ncbi:MAG: transporter substrate-binding domain-containing protein [Synergistales bacterium]|nr:transporter substrate-binding domain-containing protein [Synergistales bacterium]
MKKSFFRLTLWTILLFSLSIRPCRAGTLQEILDRGEIRHLGVPYARFVTGSGDGLDVELMERFAQYLGVSYRYVESNWEDVIPDLIGRDISISGDIAVPGANRPIMGDVIASGLTVLEWRKSVLAFSSPTFPTQVWLLSPYDHPQRPIEPCGDMAEDRSKTSDMVNGMTVMGVEQTCLDPNLYGLGDKGARIVAFKGDTSDLVPAMLGGVSDLIILDVPDVLVALSHWQGRIKVLGPISQKQDMAVAFSLDDKDLLSEFEAFYGQLIASGEYRDMVEKYYPSLFLHFPSFLEGSR